jgi:hypothetical protein
MPFVVQESGGQVRIWEEWRNAFAVLYDMNALPGDQWMMPVLIEGNVCDTTSFVEVVDTGTMVVDDVLLRWSAVERHYIMDGTEWNVFADTVIERVGFTTGYFSPHDACNAALDFDEGSELRCYTDDEISYKRIQPWSCETLLAVPAVTDAGTAAQLVPLGDGRHRVVLPAPHGAAQLTLFDAAGRQLEHHTVRDGEVLGGASQGFAVYQLRDAGGLLGVGRVLW